MAYSHIKTLIGGESYLSAEIQSVYSSAPAYWATGHLLRESLLSICRNAVYSTAPVDWTTRCGSLTPPQRCSRCILQPQLTRPLIAGDLPLCRDAVGVSYSPSWLDHSLSESYPSAEMQSVYSTAATDWTTHWGSLTPVQRCSRCILQSQPTGPLVEGVLPLRRDAVGVFYSPSWLDHSLQETYPCAEMQSVYPTVPADWTTRWGSLTPLQRCSRCILLFLPTWQLHHYFHFRDDNLRNGMQPLIGSDIVLFTRCVMVIIVGNGHGDMSSNPWRDCLLFT